VDGPAADRRCAIVVPAGLAAVSGHAYRRHHYDHRGAYLARHGDPWWHSLPFLLLTLLLAGLPLLILLLLGRRAQALLPTLRDWMNTNSWVVSEIVIVFFLALNIFGS
jgi:hypothetical protein